MVIYDAAGRPLSYYSELWLLYGIYFSPFYLGLALGPMLYFTLNKKLPLTVSHEVQLFLHSHAILLSVLLIITTGARIRSAYIILVALIFYCASSGLSTIFRLINHRRLGWIYFHVIGLVLPFIFFAYLCNVAFTTFIPMAARIGPDQYPDLVIAAFCSLIAIFLGGFIVPLIGLCTRRWWVYGGLFGLFSVAGIILLATPVGFPYRPETSPQRYWIFHTNRVFYSFGDDSIRKSDSGYMLLPMDRNSQPSFIQVGSSRPFFQQYSNTLLNYHFQSYVPEMEKALPVEEDCAKEIFCGIPLYRSSMTSQARFSHWIPASEPYLNTSVTLTRIINQIPAGRMAFQVDGPSRMAIYIAPAKGLKITNWSFHPDTPQVRIPGMPDRSGYFIARTAGKINRPYSFWFELDTPSDWPENTPQVTIGIVGHFTYHDEQITQDFRRFLNSFPDWAEVTPWMVGYRVYDF